MLGSAPKGLPTKTHAWEDSLGSFLMLDFNAAMRDLITEVVRHVGEFAPIRADQLWVSATFNRRPRRGGLLAYVLPLKYREGSPVERRERNGKVYHWAMLPTFDPGSKKEVLYIVYFMLPRFYNLTLREKMETVVHELYHVSPRFNGDLRRFKGRSVLHGDMKSYDRKVRELTDEFMAAPHDPTKYDFLRGSYNQSERRFEEILAKHIREPRPKLLKVHTLSPWFSREALDSSPWKFGMPTVAPDQ